MTKFNYFIISIFLLFIINVPEVAMARIMCNDGTISKSCNDCHQGCCSKHGGCSNSTSSSSSSNSGSSSSNNSTSNSTSTPTPKPSIVEEVKSADATLKKLTIDDEEIIIADTMTYSTTKDSVLVVATPNDSKAKVSYKKNPNLVIGENSLTITVTAENGNVKKYVLNITREKILSNNKNIKIFIDDEEIFFTSYESDIINIPYTEEKLNITYELEDINSKAIILGNENLKVGSNEIIVKVTAENGEEQDYILNVQKEKEIVNIEEKESESSAKEDEEDFGILPIIFATGILGSGGYVVAKSLKKK